MDYTKEQLNILKGVEKHLLQALEKWTGSKWQKHVYGPSDDIVYGPAGTPPVIKKQEGFDDEIEKDIERLKGGFCNHSNRLANIDRRLSRLEAFAVKTDNPNIVRNIGNSSDRTGIDMP